MAEKPKISYLQRGVDIIVIFLDTIILMLDSKINETMMTKGDDEVDVVAIFLDIIILIACASIITACISGCQI